MLRIKVRKQTFCIKSNFLKIFLSIILNNISFLNKYNVFSILYTKRLSMLVFFDECNMKKKVYFLNLKGYKCPIPILKISKKFKEIKKGDILEVDTDDPKADEDIKELSNNIKIKILEMNSLNNKMRFKLQKY